VHSQSAMPPADAASTVIDVLSARMQDVPVRGQDDARSAGLLVYLGRVPDRRRVRGRRHQLAAILALACGAVTAGAKSLTAIAEWAAAAPAAVLAAFGVRRDRRDGTWVVPSETTIRRTLGGIDADALDAQVGAWLLALAGYGAEEDGAGDQMVIAVDGKTARGARLESGRAQHLLAAVDTDTGIVLGQCEVDQKSNEITAFEPLLDRIDIAGAVISADAMHTQHRHADYLKRRGAHYLLTAKRNQPGLYEQLSGLPWRQIPIVDDTVNIGHGRIERRTLQLTAIAAGIDFPNASIAGRVIRTRKTTSTGKTERETEYTLTDLDWSDMTARQHAAGVRAHWAIEDGVHYVRDRTFDEDRSAVRTGHGPAVMACLRNLALSIHRHQGATNIAQACRYVSRHPLRAVTLIIEPGS